MVGEASSPPADIVAVVTGHDTGSAGEADGIVEWLTVMKRRDKGGGFYTGEGSFTSAQPIPLAAPLRRRTGDWELEQTFGQFLLYRMAEELQTERQMTRLFLLF